MQWSVVKSLSHYTSTAVHHTDHTHNDWNEATCTSITKMHPCKYNLVMLDATLPAPSWLRPTINVPDSTVPCYVAMDNFTQHKEDGDRWCSTPFYSARGYKMRLQVYANGHKKGTGTHVSVFVQIIQGEYDNILTWPYTGTVTFEIINCKGDRYHVGTTIDFKEAIYAGCGNKPTNENEAHGYGIPQALSHDTLYSTYSEYISNDDILYIRVSSITE